MQAMQQIQRACTKCDKHTIINTKQMQGHTTELKTKCKGATTNQKCKHAKQYKTIRKQR